MRGTFGTRVSLITSQYKSYKDRSVYTDRPDVFYMLASGKSFLIEVAVSNRSVDGQGPERNYWDSREVIDPEPVAFADFYRHIKIPIRS